MKKISLAALLLLSIISPGHGRPSGSIKGFIDSREGSSIYKIGNEYLLSDNTLRLFYLNRFYEPAWFEQHTLTGNGYDMLNYISQVGQQGLNPGDYHLAPIMMYALKIFCTTSGDSSDFMTLDLLLTDAFFLLGSNLYYGKIDPAREGASWKMQRKDPDLNLGLILETALAGKNVQNTLNILAPGHRAYWKMKEELAFFIKLNGQLWPVIFSDITIKPGDSSLVVPLIRERLIKLRYQLSDTTSEVSDELLVKQIKLFQEDRGLNPDGIIGKATLEGLNSLPGKLMNQLIVNMERFRWMPLEVAEKQIIVNIANYRLDLITGQDTLISMRVIVGKEPRTTPVFNERLSYIVFSPGWTVPHTILHDDVIPELFKGPEYLVQRNMKLLRKDGSELAYEEVDWSIISKDNFPYTVWQSPGPGNALGRVKFIFPNTYDVYLHDTPSKSSFAREERALSSGCVRVEKPFDLAVLLLSDIPEWPAQKIADAMQQEKEMTVRLKVPVAVALIYLTAWTDGRDRVQFRRDIYQRDEILLEALGHKPGVTGNSSLSLK